ncbi:MAG: aldo/keto reductase [Puniceicoccaceae bacterium]|nr:aldo/keto reductase [Puniceicoccaceae bacterium]
MSVSRRQFLKLSAGSAAVLQSNSAWAHAAEKVVLPKRQFGRHNDKLSVVGIGGHTLYMSGSQKEANSIAHRALDLGINFFENAWTYHKGEAESYMGEALKGHRDSIFLMSKFCNFRSNNYTSDAAGAMKMLEDSLRRLQTDYLDLWMMHNVCDNDANDAYRKEGAIEALELAKQQGKIRYAGFTGHTDPKVHRDIIEGGYKWDATLMPVSIVGALKSRAFESETMPLCEQHEIAVLGMKGFGGSRRTHLHEKTNVQEVLQYALSYPQVCCHVVGVDKLEYVDQAVAGCVAPPFSAPQRAKYAVNDAEGSPDLAALQHGAGYYESSCSFRHKRDVQDQHLA